MKKQFIILSSFFLLSISFTGCQVVGGIFKAGMVWGIILVLLFIFGIIYLMTRGGKK